MKKIVVLALMLISVSLIITACGETFSGMGKDTRRMGKGIKTIFIKDAE